MSAPMQASASGSFAKPVAPFDAATSKASPVVAQGDRFPELEGLRGVAALLVMFYHLPYWHPAIHALPIIDNGLLMVQLFFVLSGFVICGAYNGRITDRHALVNFQLLRFGRLYPVHLIFLLVYLAIECSKWYLATRHGIHSHNSEPFKGNSWAAFLEQLVLIHPIIPTGNALSFNSPAWSIGVEFYVYLLFGVLVAMRSQHFRLIAALLSAFSFVCLALNLLPDYRLFLMGTAGFFMGCVVQMVSAGRRNGTPRSTLNAMLVLIFCFLQIPENAISTLLVYPIAAMLIYAMVTSRDGLARAAFRSRVLGWLGRISYSVYMAHLSIIWLVTQLVRFVLSPPQALAPNGHVDAQLSGIQAAAACFAVVVLTLGVAHLVYRFVEQPLREASRRWVATRNRNSRSPVASVG